MLKFFKLLHLLFLSVYVSLIADIDLHLFRDVFGEAGTVGIQLRSLVVGEFGAADEFRQAAGSLEFCGAEGSQDALVGCGSADLYFFQSACLFLNGLFLVAYIVVLFLSNQACLIAVFAQAQVGIVLPEQESVLGAGGHHAVGFPVVLGDKVIDQNAYVSL